MALTRINNNSLSNVTSAGLPSGSVIQVVSANDNTQTNAANSDTWYDFISASITPTSSSSKILILVSATGLIRNATDVAFRLLRGSTSIMHRNRNAYVNHSSYDSCPFDAAFLDSPSTTSSTTYKAQGAKNAGDLEIGSGASFMGTDSNRKSITLIEIAG